MQNSQHPNVRNFFTRSSPSHRLIAAIIFIVIAAIFTFLFLEARGIIDTDQFTAPCGLKRAYHIPCPTCFWTTSAHAFVQGRIIEAFYVQPAAALFCLLLAITAFLAFLTAVFGIYYTPIKGLFSRHGIKYLILAIVIIVLAGWAVTLIRALVEIS